MEFAPKAANRSQQAACTFARLFNKNTIHFTTFFNLFRNYTEQMPSATRKPTACSEDTPPPSAAVRIDLAEFNRHHSDVVVGSSTGVGNPLV